MTKLLVLAATASLMFSGLALGQEKPKNSMTNCSPSSATTGSGGSEGQAVEKSAILPSAGGEVGSSSAPTVQRDGKSVEMRSDCPQEPGVAKSEKPNG